MGLFGKKLRFASKQDLETVVLWRNAIKAADGLKHLPHIADLAKRLMFKADDVERDLPGMEMRMKDGQAIFDKLMAAIAEGRKDSTPARPQPQGRPVRPTDIEL